MPLSLVIARHCEHSKTADALAEIFRGTLLRDFITSLPDSGGPLLWTLFCHGRGFAFASRLLTGGRIRFRRDE